MAIARLLHIHFAFGGGLLLNTNHLLAGMIVMPAAAEQDMHPCRRECGDCDEESKHAENRANEFNSGPNESIGKKARMVKMNRDSAMKWVWFAGIFR